MQIRFGINDSVYNKGEFARAQTLQAVNLIVDAPKNKSNRNSDYLKAVKLLEKPLLTYMSILKDKLARGEDLDSGTVENLRDFGWSLLGNLGALTLKEPASTGSPPLTQNGLDIRDSWEDLA